MISASFPDSSSIIAAGYEPNSSCLRIVFKDGSCYDFLNVPSYIFPSLTNARSKGAFFNASIRNVFPATRQAPLCVFK